MRKYRTPLNVCDICSSKLAEEDSNKSITIHAYRPDAAEIYRQKDAKMHDEVAEEWLQTRRVSLMK